MSETGNTPKIWFFFQAAMMYYSVGFFCCWWFVFGFCFFALVRISENFSDSYFSPSPMDI